MSGGKEFIQKLENIDRQYFPQTKRLEEEGNVDFTSYEKIVEFISIRIIQQYAGYLVKQKKKVVKNEVEQQLWMNQVEGIEPVYSAFQGEFWRIYYERQKQSKSLKGRFRLINWSEIVIDENSDIYHNPIEVMKEKGFPNLVFPLYEKYIINLKKMSVSKI